MICTWPVFSPLFALAYPASSVVYTSTSCHPGLSQITTHTVAGTMRSIFTMFISACTSFTRFHASRHRCTVFFRAR